jgi:type VI secretion system Hcp family effector
MAVVDMFLKLDGVDGESQDKDHKNEIDILGFKLSSKSPRDASTGQATGKVRFTNLTVRSNIEKATAKLFQKLTMNEKIEVPDPKTGAKQTLLQTQKGKQLIETPGAGGAK